ncbi:hypothetical protein LBSP_21620 [Lentilactobacillus buchneri subsp. silagei]|uniref:DUF3892 domain-containing protein n=1 Tax=Lentilactobacillus buchneri TaxID=1581 RepID=UPI0012E452B8|nr:DUF3892 domain-containing protein [Lentilactobacillus buchneri]GED95602.1 hypothetical protein LBSP_21620 [Lentilactobacillus buchneri subsp. silagei]
MAEEIVKVHTQNNFSFIENESDIVSVQLANGNIESKEQVIEWLDLNLRYFFTTSSYSEADVEAVHPDYPEKSYIRTVPNATTSDNLLSLPRF